MTDTPEYLIAFDESRRCPRCHELVCVCRSGFAALWPIPPYGGHPQLDADLMAQHARDVVYRERTFVVAALAHLVWISKTSAHWMAWVAPHLDPRPEQRGDTWDPDWRNVVYVRLPTGIVSWHIHRHEMPLFNFLPRLSATDLDRAYAEPYRYDGHSTEEKYRRIYEYVTGRAR